jgi:hypothetical protein
MGRVWSVDAIAKNASTSMYGSLIALDESPLVEGLLYVGTDDGLIHVSQDGGNSWARHESFAGVPDQSLVEDIVASRHDPDVAYAVFDNHKRGDHRPYVLKSSDRGQRWRLISGGLPERGTVHTLAEDHVAPGLLFVGTEFGLYFTNDGGDHWQELTQLPTIAVRDLEIQRRENDLVVGTFGRGIYILDDYRPLRSSNEALAAPILFDARDGWLFNPDSRRGWGGKGDYGTGRYAADNPPYGAVFSYYLPDDLRSLKEQRRDEERKRAAGGGDNPYPGWDRLRQEDREEPPAVLLTVTDSAGAVVRRLEGPADKGFHRVAWDMRYPAPDPVVLEPPPDLPPWQREPIGPMALPGSYSVTLARRVQGQYEQLGSPQAFELKPLFSGGLIADDRVSVLEFQAQTATLYRAVSGADRAATEIEGRIDHLLRAVTDTPAATEAQGAALRALKARMQELRVALNGDSTRASRFEPAPLALLDRVGFIVGGGWGSQSAVTGNHRESFRIAGEQYRSVQAELTAVEDQLGALEAELDALGAPWTPARLPGPLDR